MANAVVTSQTVALLMKISDISKLTRVRSLEVTIHGIPWKVTVSKNEQKNSLSVYLRCAENDKTSTWTAPACATIKLTCYSDEENALERYVPPHAFNASSLTFGSSSFIGWDELLKDESGYVQDDTIELKIEITAENPNDVDRSILKYESINCGSHATFRLTVTNVKNLLAVRLPQFIVRGLSWDLMICKNQTSKLVIMLFALKSPTNAPSKMKLTAKLLSSENEENVIKKSSTGKVQCKPGSIRIADLISWDELLKPENGYIHNNSITLEVKIKPDKPVRDAPNLDANTAAKRSRFECSICLEDIGSQDVSATPCCHLFCTACITEAVQKSPVCPLCKEPVELNDLRRMYLSASK